MQHVRAISAIAPLRPALLLRKLDHAEYGKRHHDGDQRISDDKSGFHFGSDVRQLSEWLSVRRARHTALFKDSGIYSPSLIAKVGQDAFWTGVWNEAGGALLVLADNEGGPYD